MALTQESPFACSSFRWLLFGGTLSSLGEQFTLIALPWLVLKLTGDPLMVGTMLAVISVPRAIFSLLGGALVDRHSPRRVLLLTKVLNAGLLGLLALLVGAGVIRMPMVYALAAAIGLASAFSLPAATSLLPRILAPDLLRAANGIQMGFAQATLLVGPLAAGALIGGYGAYGGFGADGRRGALGVGDAQGLWLAFAFDAGTFVVSAWTLLRVHVSRPVPAAQFRSVLHGTRDVALFLWRDKELRTLGLYYAAIAFFVSGPIQVALPVLANTQLPGGATSLGLLLAGHGLGSLVGMAVSSLRSNWRIGTLGITILACDALAGLAFVPFGRIAATWQGIALLAPIGALSGFVQVAVLAWMQVRVPAAMLGRAMSVVIFLFLGVAPLATVIAGAALRVVAPSTLFTASGLTLLAIALIGRVFTPIRQIRDVRPLPGPAEGAGRAVG